MKKLFTMALIATTMFASCSKTDQPEKPKGEQTVTISFAQGLPSKSIEGQKSSGDYGVISSGKLVFLNESDVNVFQRDLTNDEVTTIANTNTTTGNKTLTISGIPNDAVKLRFIANCSTADNTSLPELVEPTTSSSRLRIDMLQDNVENIPMAGVSSTFTLAAGTTNEYNASVTINPIVSRLELGQISCTNENSSSQLNTDITSYKLAGVYINNLRPYVMMNGRPYLTTDAVDIRNQSGWEDSWENYFEDTNLIFPYYPGGSVTSPSDWTENSFVHFCTPANSALTFYPDLTTGATNTNPTTTPANVWAFQVTPSEEGSNASASIPHLILKLIDVEYVDRPLGSDEQYVTVTKYLDESGNDVTSFEPGNVYRISNLTFSHNQATNKPYEDNILVTATISVAPWVINNIKPNWDI